MKVMSSLLEVRFCFRNRQPGHNLNEPSHLTVRLFPEPGKAVASDSGSFEPCTGNVGVALNNSSMLLLLFLGLLGVLFVFLGRILNRKQILLIPCDFLIIWS